MSIGTRGSSSAGGEVWGDGEGLDKRSASGSGEGTFSIRSESKVVDIVVVQIMSGG